MVEHGDTGHQEVKRHHGDLTDEERAALFDIYAERQSDNANSTDDPATRRFCAAQARSWRKMASDLRKGKNVY